MYGDDLNFSWVVPGKLAGCARPSGRPDIAFLATQGVRALVRLARPREGVLHPRDMQEAGIEDYYEPVEDFTAPSQEQIDRLVAFIQSRINGGKAVAVSCGAGHGRTGTVLSCYLVSTGMSADEAVAAMHAAGRAPYERGATGQLEAIHEYARRLGRRPARP